VRTGTAAGAPSGVAVGTGATQTPAATAGTAVPTPGAADAAASGSADLRTSLEAAERAAIRRALSQSSWKVTEAARKLGIDRVTLHKKMKKLGIEKKILEE
jgi:transcriptional regulator of acetoin/glycerol metabolism